MNLIKLLMERIFWKQIDPNIKKSLENHISLYKDTSNSKLIDEIYEKIFSFIWEDRSQWKNNPNNLKSIKFDNSKVYWNNTYCNSLGNIERELFNEMTDNDKYIYTVDCNHEIYKISPFKFYKEKISYYIGLIADWDFHMIISEDYNNLIYVDPYEQSFTVYGEQFIQIITKYINKLEKIWIKKIKQIQNDFHVCPGCWYFTLKKWVWVYCNLCWWHHDWVSKLFPIRITGNSLGDYQKKVLNNTYDEYNKKDNYVRHPLWKPLSNLDKKYSENELFDWYNNTLEYSTLSELIKYWIVKPNTSDIQKATYTIYYQNHWRMCPVCWFNTLDEWELFNYNICEICFWEDEDLWKWYPARAGWPNRESLIELQEYILNNIPVAIKEHHWYKRDEDWRPTNKSEIKDINKPYMEKWFYNKFLSDSICDYDKIQFKEAQEINPSKY